MVLPAPAPSQSPLPAVALLRASVSPTLRGAPLTPRVLSDTTGSLEPDNQQIQTPFPTRGRQTHHLHQTPFPITCIKQRLRACQSTSTALDKAPGDGGISWGLLGEPPIARHSRTELPVLLETPGNHQIPCNPPSCERLRRGSRCYHLTPPTSLAPHPAGTPGVDGGDFSTAPCLRDTSCSRDNVQGGSLHERACPPCLPSTLCAFFHLLLLLLRAPSHRGWLRHCELWTLILL